MKKIILIVGLVVFHGNIISMQNKNRKAYNPELVSICFPLQKKQKNDPAPFFQLSHQSEQIIPKIADLIDEEGRVNIHTNVPLAIAQNILFNYCKKNILGLNDTLKNLTAAEYGDLSNNLFNPLGITICGKLPTFYDKEVPISDAVQGGRKEDYFSFIVSKDAGKASWTNRLGMVSLQKQSVNGVIARQAISDNNVVALSISHKITEQQAQTLVVLVGAYIKAFANTNPATRIQDLKQICNQVPALLVRNFRSNIARILNVADKDIIGFEDNIIQTGAKSMWNYMRDGFAIAGILLIGWMGISKLRS